MRHYFLLTSLLFSISIFAKDCEEKARMRLSEYLKKYTIMYTDKYGRHHPNTYLVPQKQELSDAYKAELKGYLRYMGVMTVKGSDLYSGWVTQKVVVSFDVPSDCGPTNHHILDQVFVLSEVTQY